MSAVYFLGKTLTLNKDMFHSVTRSIIKCDNKFKIFGIDSKSYENKYYLYDVIRDMSSVKPSDIDDWFYIFQAFVYLTD